MDNRQIYELFKDAYEFEHQRKDAINSRLSLVFTALTVIIGATTYFINNMNFTPINTVRVVFFTLLGALVTIIGLALYYLFRCLFFYKYSYVARPSLIDKYITELEDYEEKLGSPINIEEKIEYFLKSQYRDCTSRNRANNKRKNGYFIRVLMAVFLASIFLSLLAIPYYVTKFMESKQIVYVNIENFREISKMSNEKETWEPEPEPVEPTPPAVEEINEAEVEDSDIEARIDSDE